MTDVIVAQPAPKVSSAFLVETVTWVQHWTESLFSFRTTRDPGFRFTSGQFVMVGLTLPNGKPLVRAYSVLGETRARDAALKEAKTRYRTRPDILESLDAAARAEPMK